MYDLIPILSLLFMEQNLLLDIYQLWLEFLSSIALNSDQNEIVKMIGNCVYLIQFDKVTHANVELDM